MSNFTYRISPNELVFGNTNDSVAFSLNIVANVRGNVPTLYLEVPYGNAANQLIKGDISTIKIQTPSNKWSVEKELIIDDSVVLFTISGAKLKKGKTVNIGFVNVPINCIQGTTTLKVFEGEDLVLSQAVKKVENRIPSINIFRATLPFIIRKGDTTLYWSVANGKDIALYRQYVKHFPRSIDAATIKEQADTKLLKHGLAKNGTYEIKELEKSAIFYLFADNDNSHSPYASCNIAVQEPLIIDFKIIEGKEEEHIYGSPLVLSWITQFSNPNNPENQCWIQYKVYNEDGSVKETGKVENLSKEGTYTFYPTAPTDYTLYIKEPDFNRIMEEISITISPTTPIGAITMFAGKEMPEGWMFCDGKRIEERTFKERFKNKDKRLVTESYKELMAVIGNQLPDLRDRFIMGANSQNINEKGEADKHYHKVSYVKKDYKTSWNGSHTHKFPSDWYKRDLRGGEYTGIDIGGKKVSDAKTSSDGNHRHTVNLEFHFDTELNDTPTHPAWYQLAFIIKVLF